MKCDNYNSLITLNEGVMPCGLLDRLLNLRVWSQLAASLCARLELPPVCKMMSRSLAGGELPSDLSWDHYVNVRMLSDGSSIFNAPGEWNRNRTVIPEDIGEINPSMAEPTVSDRLRGMAWSEGPLKRDEAADRLRGKIEQAKQA